MKSSAKKIGGLSLVVVLVLLGVEIGLRIAGFQVYEPFPTQLTQI